MQLYNPQSHQSPEEIFREIKQNVAKRIREVNGLPPRKYPRKKKKTVDQRIDDIILINRSLIIK
jgi:hypothetical protein